ncbi:MAG: hypothetical protein AAGD96_28235 [Chloroflexota bacterium]
MNSVRNQILCLPFIKVVQTCAPYVFVIQLLPFDHKNEIPTTKMKRLDSNQDRQDSNIKSDTADSASRTGGIQQQHIVAISSLLVKGGFKFAKEVIYNLAKYSAEAIALAIEYVKIKQAGRRIVSNPEGYLIDCLERGYWKSLKDPSSRSHYWQKVVDNFTANAIAIKDKLQSLPGIKNNSLNKLLELLQEDYYGEEVVKEAFGEAIFDIEITKPQLGRRRRGRGFATS